MEFVSSERVGLPSRVGQIRLFEPFGEKAGLRALVEKTEAGDYSAIVVDKGGSVLLEMTGYATVESPMTIDAERLSTLRAVLAGSQPETKS